MSDYNLNVNVKIKADDLAAAYGVVADALDKLKHLGDITKVDLAEPKQSGTWNGHTPGCRMSDGRRSGTCTCGPVPR